jgi:hypothetical protein
MVLPGPWAKGLWLCRFRHSLAGLGDRSRCYSMQVFFIPCRKRNGRTVYQAQRWHVEKLEPRRATEDVCQTLLLMGRICKIGPTLRVRAV